MAVDGADDALHEDRRSTESLKKSGFGGLFLGRLGKPPAGRAMHIGDRLGPSAYSAVGVVVGVGSGQGEVQLLFRNYARLVRHRTGLPTKRTLLHSASQLSTHEPAADRMSHKERHANRA